MYTTAIRMALRSLRHTPGLAVAAIACSAIGVAATTAVAALVSAAMLRPVPFPAADRLVRIWLANDGAQDQRVSLSIPEIREVAAGVGAFDAFLGTARTRLVALLEAGAERLRGEAVTADYFAALGLRPHLGRLFDARDFTASASRVVILSARTWRLHFGGDPAVVGKVLRTETDTFSIVGVAPVGFAGTIEDDLVEFWIPLQQYVPPAYLQMRDARMAWAIGRLRPLATPASAEAELQALFGALAKDFPGVYNGLRLRVEPMGENWRGRYRTSGSVLAAAALLLLIVAALNVAGLLVARAIDRQREMSVRAAIGASRRHLIGQLVVEALLLVVVGGGLGAIAAPAVLDAFVAMAPIQLPAYVRLEPDATTAAMAFAAIVAVGLLAGWIPGLLAGRVSPADALRTSARGAIGGGRERRWGSLIVAAETAVALALVVVGTLLLQSYRNLGAVDPGFRVDGVARLAVTTSRLDVRDAATLPAFYERLTTELGRVPGVERVGLVAPTLPPWDGERGRVRFPGMDDRVAESGLAVGLHRVDGGLLPMLDIDIVAGRNLEAADAARDPVALVSVELASRLGGPAAALGRDITVASDDGMAVGRVRVVGVVPNVAYDGLAEQMTGRLLAFGAAGADPAVRADVYLPLARFPQRTFSIGVTTGGDPGALIEPLRRTLGRIAPASAVHWTGTMPDEYGREYAASRFYAILVNGFSVSALVLTGVGLFAVMSHLVSRRMREIGLRRALGSSPAQLAGYVTGLALAPFCAGVATGLGVAAVVARAAAALLHGVGLLDAASFLASAMVMLVVAAVAVAVPARRAARVDPMVALRAD